MIEAILLSLPTALYLLLLRRRPDAAGAMGMRLPVRRTDWLWGLALAAAGVLAGWMSTALVPSDVLHGPGTTGRITTVIAGLLVVLRAVAEELFFRGFLQGVTRRWGAAAAIAISSVAFLAPHLLLLTISASLAPLVVTQFLLGVALGLLRERSRSIWPGALAHVTVNLIAGLLL